MAIDERHSRTRFLGFRIVILCAFATVALKLWGLQVTSAERYRDSADQNRFRLVSIDAPRGIIYDRFGRIMVRNVPSFAVSIVPAGLPDDDTERQAMLVRLGELLNMPVDGDLPPADGSVAANAPAQRPSILRLLSERTVSPYAPVRIASNVDRQAAFVIEEEHLALPGVIVEAEPLRRYTDGPLTAHLLGYVGSIPSDALPAYRQGGYEPGDRVGLTGIERTQESYLKGTKGQKHIEVDAFEREVAVIASTAPVQGDNVVLTIDLELQSATERALREGMRKAKSKVGVAIAMDPRTGEILAMVSLPNYDNNLFSGGISYDDYLALSSDRSHPMVNHAVSGQYPPGSIFKIVPATAALQEHVIDAHTQIHCPGIIYVPNRYFPDDMTKAQPFYCWQLAGHGSLSVVGGLMQSCDVFFYEAAGGYKEFHGLGIEKLADYAAMFGLGEPTGIELSGEASGLLPSDRWKRQNYGESWYTGDTYNAAIGQGYILATPLQMLNATAAVANGGTLYRPQLVYQIVSPDGRVLHALTPEPIRELTVDKEYLALVREGMRMAVDAGTAWNIRIPGLSVAGKTGSAEYPAVDEDGNLMYDEKGYLPTHAWFTAFAPVEAPEIALIVFLEGGGEGSQMAVPVAAEVMRYYYALPDPRPAAIATPIAPTPTP
jgi:penicillin-binding protein 2